MVETTLDLKGVSTPEEKEEEEMSLGSDFGSSGGSESESDPKP